MTGLLLSGVVGPGLEDAEGLEDDWRAGQSAGAAWTAATLRPAREGYGDAIRPIPTRVQALCAEIGVLDAEIESYVVAMLELEACDDDVDDVDSAANLKGIAELLASHCDVDQDSIYALLVSIGPFK